MKEREGVKAKEGDDVYAALGKLITRKEVVLGRCAWPTCVLEL